MASLTPKKSTTQDDEPQFEEDNSPPRIQARHYAAASTNKQAPPYGGATVLPLFCEISNNSLATYSLKFNILVLLLGSGKISRHTQ